MGNEKFSILGELSIIRLPDDQMLFGDDLKRAQDAGRVSVDTVLKNLVVDVGLSVLSRLLGGNAGGPQVYHPMTPFGFSSVQDITVARMELGVQVNPPVPANGDYTSVGSFLFAPNLTVTYPDDYSVQFSGLVPMGDFDGVTFTEEALLLRNGNLFAKKTFSQQKTLAFALQFDHKFTFSRA